MMTHDVGLTMGAYTLWQEKLLLDYTIEVEDEQFKVHKVVMASVSDYFKAMLTGGMLESQADRVRLEGLDPVAVSNMIEFIYTGQFGSNKASLEDLLGCAVYFQIDAAIDKCTDLLVEQLNNSNCLDVLHLFRTYSLDNGIDETVAYIKKNLEDILQDSSALKYDSLLYLLDFWVKSEWVLFEGIKQWVMVDSENRRQHLPELMACVRFALIAPEKLATIKDMDMYSDTEGGWCELVRNAEEYHNLPTHMKVLHNSEQNRVRADSSPVICTEEITGNPLYFSLTDEGLWNQKEMGYTLDHGVSSYILVNNFVVIADDNAIRGWYIVDPRTLKWSRIARMSGPRANFALVHHDNHLYALGGCTKQIVKGYPCTSDHIFIQDEIKIRTNTIERYNFETNVWSIFPIKMPVASEYHGAGVINNCIYVTGGCCSVPEKLCRAPTEFLTRLDRLDLTTGTWESRAPMTEPVNKYNTIQVMQLWGEEVLFILDEPLLLRYYSPTTDQWSVLDCCTYRGVSELERSYYSTVLVDRNTLFLLDFPRMPDHTDDDDDNYDDDDHLKYDPLNACVVWKFEQSGKIISETCLADYPISREYCNNEPIVFRTLLSILPSDL